MGALIGLPFLGLAAILQSSVLPHLELAGARPDLVLLLAISWTLLRSPGEGLAWAFMGGIVLDSLSASPFGFLTLSLLAAVFAAGFVTSVTFGANLAIPTAALVVGSMLYKGVLMALMRLNGHPGIELGSLAQAIALSTALNLCLAPAILWPLARLHRATRPEEVTL